VQAVFYARDEMAAYLHLEYYEGGNMWQWIERDVPCMVQRKKALSQLAEGLAHMHGLGVAHGDVKLQNVLISAQARGETRRARVGASRCKVSRAPTRLTIHLPACYSG
jgi:serine/threonine protein kinase